MKDLILDDKTSGTEMGAYIRKDGVPLEHRLAIYRNNVNGSLSNSLLEKFPLLLKLTGEKFMKQAVREFIRSIPPHSGCLNLYGQGFDNFLNSYRPAKKFPFLADVARMELAVNRSFYAEDDEVMVAHDWADIDENDLAQFSLILRHSVELMCSLFPLIDIKNACNDEVFVNNINMLESEDHFFIVYRPQHSVFIDEVKKDDFIFLQKITEKYSLGQAIEKTLEAFPEFDFVSFLQTYFTKKIFRKSILK